MDVTFPVKKTRVWSDSAFMSEKTNTQNETTTQHGWQQKNPLDIPVSGIAHRATKTVAASLGKESCHGKSVR